METQLKSAKFQPYSYILPVYDSKYLTYNLPLVGMDNLRTFSTRLESTSQVLSYGHDLFLARVTPDKKYDMIDEEFNYGLLFVAIGGLMVATYMTRSFIKKSQNKKKFLLH